MDSFGTNYLPKVFKKIHLSSLAYGRVKVTDRVTYITNEQIPSRHDCVWTIHLWSGLGYATGWVQTV